MKYSHEWSRVPKEQLEIILKYQNSFPIKLGAIAKEFGITVKKSTLKPGISGQIKETDGSVIIKINRHDSEGRQRFTLAHELAHFLLHKHALQDGIEDTILFRSSLSNQLEVEANRLAADIVMPFSLIDDITFAPQTRLEVRAEHIASVAKLSIPAIEIRLGKKGY